MYALVNPPRQTGRDAVNRRMRMLESGATTREVFETLRRRRSDSATDSSRALACGSRLPWSTITMARSIAAEHRQRPHAGPTPPRLGSGGLLLFTYDVVVSIHDPCVPKVGVG